MGLIVWKVIHLGQDKDLRTIVAGVLDLVLHGIQHLALTRLIKHLLTRRPTTLLNANIDYSLLTLASPLLADLDLCKRFLIRVIIDQ